MHHARTHGPAAPTGSISMDQETRRHRPQWPQPIRGGAAALLVLVLVGGSSVAACTGTHDEPTSAAMAAQPTMHVEAVADGTDTVAIDAMWAARPDYVRSHPAVEAAYDYAIHNPQIIEWMPCYCGCGEMGHGSNLDCYIRPADGTFEEHASYCDICVEITLKTKELVDQGVNLRQIRMIVDQTWGGSTPGTPTALPPV